MNVTGKGGFGDHPEHINYEGAPSRFSLRALFHRLIQEIPEGEQESYAELILRDYIKDTWQRKDGVAIRDMIDQTDGRPKQALEVSGPGEEPIGLVFVRPGEVTEDNTSSSTG